MIPNQDAIDNLAHRLRMLTHTARTHIDLLGTPNLNSEKARNIRGDLHDYLLTVLATLDTLSPIHAVHDEPDGNVVEMAVWPRPAPVRAVMPPVYAEKPEVWR